MNNKDEKTKLIAAVKLEKEDEKKGNAEEEVAFELFCKE